MHRPSDNLENQILVAWERAMAEDRPDVAEHLLRALEVLCGGDLAGSALATAYAMLAARKPRHPRKR
jgi:hypothetical protein